MNMPCFPKFHISVPDGEVDEFRQLVIDEDWPNVFIWPEVLPFPRNDWAWGGKGASQWTEFIADEHVKAPWILYLDADLMFTMPSNCAMNFDDEGKPAPCDRGCEACFEHLSVRKRRLRIDAWASGGEAGLLGINACVATSASFPSLEIGHLTSLCSLR